MSEAPAPPPLFPWPIRWGLPLAACSLACGLSEGLMRLADGNAFPQVDIFEAREGQLRLEANAEARVRRPDGGIYTLRTGARGLRSPTGSDVLIVGDSQVLGYGVEDDEPFPALLRVFNAGVPGHGIADAVQHAAELIPALRPSVVLLVVNQANDWDEGMKPALERYVVRNGWLGSASQANATGVRFWSSPLSRVHLLAYPALVIFKRAPQPPGLPDPALATTFRSAFDALAHENPGVRFIAAYLPVDAATSSVRAAASPLALPGEPWADTTIHDATLAAFAGTEIIDLLPILSEPDNFQVGDYHLSVKGHAAVAGVVRERLR
ncbi:hypothetical protein LBMAG42_15530 [Deltaproteobacteria bacterium]|nr:hypothetical protein LBMAG42_15530 [Deltaproteobacteria bacterium]